MFAFGLLLCMMISAVIQMSAAQQTNARKVNVTEGHNITVTCNVTQMLGNEIFWTKNETNSTFTQQGRVLTFLDVKRVSKGQYLCHRLVHESGSDEIVDDVILDVQYPAKILFAHVGPYVLTENETFSFGCGMEGNPDPNWYIGNRDTGVKIFTANAPAPSVELTGIHVDCTSSGFWECRGSNSLNHGVDVFFGHNITVLCSPRPQQGVTFVVYSDVNQSAVLTMKYLATPLPEVTWTGPRGRNSSHYPQNSSTLLTSLTIPNVQVSDFGNYTLTMKNSIGEYTAEYVLAPKGRPEAPTGLRYSQVTDERVTLHFTAGYNMGSTQLFRVMVVKDDKVEELSNWFVRDNSTDHGAGRQWTITQQALDSETMYTLTVVAENDWRLTSPPATPYVTFRTAALPQPHKRRALVGVVLASVGGAILVVCVVVLVILSARHWRRHGYTDFSKLEKRRQEKC